MSAPILAALGALYGGATGLLVRRALRLGRHRRYDDEHARPLPSYGLLPLLAALAAGVLCWRLAPGGPTLALGLASLVPLYAALGAIDLDVHRLPDVLTLPAYPLSFLALALASTAAPDPLETLRRAGLGGATALAAFFVLHVASGRKLGLGDVKLAGPLGALLACFSWERLLGGVYAMFLVGGLTAAYLMARGRAGRHTRVAFGPAMIWGAWAGLLLGTPTLG